MNDTEKLKSTTPKVVPSHLKRRLLMANRNQMEMRHACLDDLIGENHPARRVWEYVERLNLTTALSTIKSVEGGTGRSAIDPKILVCLWLYAAICGIGSAWTLAEYCGDHEGFKWICGGVSIDRKTLSNFRKNAGDVFDELLIKGVAMLTHAGLVTMEEIAQDGMKLKASASKGSFCKKQKIQEHLKEAKARIAQLKQEIENDPAINKKRLHAARIRAANDRLQRLKQAEKELKSYCEKQNRQREKYKKKLLTNKQQKKLKVSTTDPEARVMKMANSGFNPAYSVQLGVDTLTNVIIAVDVTQQKTDGGMMLPMFKDIRQTYNQTPQRYLVDSGYKNKDDLSAMHEAGCLVYMPTEGKKGKKALFDTANKDEAIQALLTRMGTEEGKRVYKNRKSTVECVNAQVRNRGFYTSPLRGMQKVRTCLTLVATAHNLLQTMVFGLA